jgi:hypothetical protein
MDNNQNSDDLTPELNLSSPEGIEIIRRTMINLKIGKSEADIYNDLINDGLTEQSARRVICVSNGANDGEPSGSEYWVLVILSCVGYFLLCCCASWMASLMFNGNTKPFEMLLGGIVWLIKDESDSYEEVLTGAKYGYIMYLVTMLAYCTLIFS